MEFNASLEVFDSAREYVEEQLEICEMGPAKIMQMSLVFEELFANIANYAYPDGNGKVLIDVFREGTRAVLRFTDNGFAFDPLAKDDPDISLGIEDRPIGGLGIFLSRKLSDSITYKRENEQNILTVEKEI